MEEIIFSVIIPHKNIPDLLQRCLDSIPRREDIQIIVVDDNSDEKEVDFENFPGLKDKYVELYLTKEGKGAGYARNVGLTHAKGKWLLFADADDFFMENAFEYFFTLKESPHDIIYFRVTSCYSDTYEPADRGYRVNKLVGEFCKKKKDSETKLRCNHVVPWGKMIKTEPVRLSNIRFDEVICANDLMFSAITGTRAASIDVVNSPVYCVTIRRNSLVHIRSYERLLISYIVVLRVNQFYRESGKYKYQHRTMRHIYFAASYGIVPFFYFIILSIRYGNNIFTGMCSFMWITDYLRLYKYRRMNRKYFVCK